MLSLQDHQTTNFIERDKKGTFFFGMYFTTIGVSPGFFQNQALRIPVGQTPPTVARSPKMKLGIAISPPVPLGSSRWGCAFRGV
jgi:hypothetical protein